MKPPNDEVIGVVAAGADARSRQKRGVARRSQILDEAVQLLAEKGFRGTSLAEIAERVGVTHQSLLYYFGSKDRLLAEVVAERERMERSTYHGFPGGPDATLDALIDVAKVIVDGSLFTRLYVVLAAENLDPGDSLHDFFVDRYALARGLVADALANGIEAGVLGSDFDRDQVAREVIAVLMGLEAQWLMDRSAFDLIEAVRAYTAALQDRLGVKGRS